MYLKPEVPNISILLNGERCGTEPTHLTLHNASLPLHLPLSAYAPGGKMRFLGDFLEDLWDCVCYFKLWIHGIIPELDTLSSSQHLRMEILQSTFIWTFRQLMDLDRIEDVYKVNLSFWAIAFFFVT